MLNVHSFITTHHTNYYVSFELHSHNMPSHIHRAQSTGLSRMRAVCHSHSLEDEGRKKVCEKWKKRKDKVNSTCRIFFASPSRNMLCFRFCINMFRVGAMRGEIISIRFGSMYSDSGGAAGWQSANAFYIIEDMCVNSDGLTCVHYEIVLVFPTHTHTPFTYLQKRANRIKLTTRQKQKKIYMNKWSKKARRSSLFAKQT